MFVEQSVLASAVVPLQAHGADLVLVLLALNP